jgi:hypothetical protein
MRPFTKVSASLIAAVLAVASLAPVAQAQHPSFAARMNVPFSFETVSGQHFQPGVYTITISGTQTALIEGAAGRGLALIGQLGYVGLPVSHGKAVFAHYGDRYYLRSVSVAGNSAQLLFPRSKAERQSQVEFEKSHAAREMAVLQTER